MLWDEEIKEPMGVLSEISGDEEVVKLAELREKALRDEENRLRGAIREANEKTAYNLLKLEIAIEVVAEATGLSVERVKEIKKRIE